MKIIIREQVKEECLDKFTVIITSDSNKISYFYGMSHTGEGFDQFVGDSRDGLKDGKHLGIKRNFEDMDPKMQRRIFNRMIDSN